MVVMNGAKSRWFGVERDLFFKYLYDENGVGIGKSSVRS